MNVLIIDDEAEIFCPIMEVKWAKGNGVDLQGARSGDEGIAILQNQQKKVDVVLMDGNLIGEKGHQIVRKIREAGINVPIWMISGDPLENKKGLKEGADGIALEEFKGEITEESFLATLTTLV